MVDVIQTGTDDLRRNGRRQDLKRGKIVFIVDIDVFRIRNDNAVADLTAESAVAVSEITEHEKTPG